jgi:hypothetical protein
MKNLSTFEMPEWMKDPHALDFIDVTKGTGMTEEEIGRLADDPIFDDDDEDLDAEDDEADDQEDDDGLGAYLEGIDEDGGQDDVKRPGTQKKGPSSSHGTRVRKKRATMEKSSKSTSKPSRRKLIPELADLPKITTTIKREWLREIAAGRKLVENREIKPYWTRRFSEVKAPFLLRLINGMQPKAPELTVVVRRVWKKSRQYALDLGKVVDLRYWNLKLEQPANRVISKRVKRRAGKADMGTCSIMGSCVYTIVGGKELDRRYNKREASPFKEKRRWVTAEKEWLKGRSENMSMPVLFGDAAHCSRLLYWGLLTDLEVRDDGTSFTVDYLRRLNGRRKTQDLVLLSTGKKIASGFIKPYAICYTPRYLREGRL